MKPSHSQPIDWQELRVLAALFLRLGATSFGGPVAHIALMEDEVVTRRKWVDRQHFLDLVGATNLIPGPNSTELAIHIGQLRAGWPGLIVAGTAFILPAFLIVLLLASLYTHYGTLPQAQWLLYGVKPVVIAIIAQALWKFLGTALKGIFTVGIAVVAAILVVCGINEITVIALAAGVGLLAGWLTRNSTQTIAAETLSTTENEVVQEVTQPPAQPPHLNPAFIVIGGGTISPPLWQLFLAFLKFGSVIYGSGYVLLAFLRADLVENLRWLTDQQLLDAIAIGQVTPGPVFTTATFIGYQIAGVGGAVAATLGIFLPSFVFVGLLSVMMDSLRSSTIMRKFLDSVNAASLALMVLVTYQLLRASLVDVPTIVIALLSLLVLIYTRLNSAWLIGAGALFGFILQGR